MSEVARICDITHFCATFESKWSLLVCLARLLSFKFFFFLYIYFVYSFNVAQNYTRDIASTVLISANRHKEKEKLPWFF